MLSRTVSLVFQPCRTRPASCPNILEPIQRLRSFRTVSHDGLRVAPVPLERSRSRDGIAIGMGGATLRWLSCASAQCDRNTWTRGALLEDAPAQVFSGLLLRGYRGRRTSLVCECTYVAALMVLEMSTCFTKPNGPRQLTMAPDPIARRELVFGHCRSVLRCPFHWLSLDQHAFKNPYER